MDEVMSVDGIGSFLKTKWAGRQLEVYKETDSTNNDAAQRAKEGAVSGTLIVADKQTSGRGRHGHVWQTPEEKNIAMSILVRPEFDIGKAPMLTLVMGMAVAKAIEDVTMLKAGIKWPNDVVINNKKLCGILTELHPEPDNKSFCVVIGVGINVNQESFADDIADMAGSLLTETGKKYDRNKVIAKVMEAFEGYYEIFAKTGSLEGLKEAYEERLLNKGECVRVLDPLHEYQGVCLGIALGGELLVQKDNGEVVRVNAGEVSVRGLYGYAV